MFNHYLLKTHSDRFGMKEQYKNFELVVFVKFDLYNNSYARQAICFFRDIHLVKNLRDLYVTKLIRHFVDTRFVCIVKHQAQNTIRNKAEEVAVLELVYLVHT